MLFARAKSKRRVRRHSRSVVIVAWMLVAVWGVLAVGVPLPGKISKDVSVPFPCMDCECGCVSAEQCWKSCCCHSDQEKLDWAIAYQVTPPEYVVEAARRAATTEKNEPNRKREVPACCQHRRAYPNDDSHAHDINCPAAKLSAEQSAKSELSHDVIKFVPPNCVAYSPDAGSKPNERETSSAQAEHVEDADKTCHTSGKCGGTSSQPTPGSGQIHFAKLLRCKGLSVHYLAVDLVLPTIRFESPQPQPIVETIVLIDLLPLGERASPDIPPPRMV